MNVNIVTIDQRYQVATGECLNFILLRLPDGREFHAQVTAEVVELLVGANLPVEEEPIVGEKSAPPLKEDRMTSEEDKAPPETILWSELPEEILSARMKAAFTALGVDSELTPLRIQGLVSTVESSFTQQDWDEVFGIKRPTPSAAPQPAPPPAPPVGVIQWADGAPILSGASPSRTVPKDEMGYPLVSGSGVARSDFLSNDSTADEDGVGQI